MDPTKGLNRSIWGVEAISHKITAENLIFADFPISTPSAADFVIYLDDRNIFLFNFVPPRSLGTIEG